MQKQVNVDEYKIRYLNFLYDYFGTGKLNDTRKKYFSGSTLRKPVIYLYPEKTQKIDLQLAFDGNLDFTYPKYDSAWSVIAEPNGDLLNLADSSFHTYLFWEGTSNKSFQSVMTRDSGFVIASENTVDFLKTQLTAIGLKPKEYNDFIVYWAPILEKNPYNHFYFMLTEEYEKEIAPIQIEPKPDASLRVFMFYRAENKSSELIPLQFTPFKRKGFTFVEWGGTEIEKF